MRKMWENSVRFGHCATVVLCILCLSGMASVADSSAEGEGETVAAGDKDVRFYFGLTAGGGVSSDWLAYRSDENTYDNIVGGYAEFAFEPGVVWSGSALHLVLGYHNPAIGKSASGEFYYNAEAEPPQQRRGMKSAALFRAGLGYKYLPGNSGIFGAARVNTVVMVVAPQVSAPLVPSLLWRKGFEFDGAFGGRTLLGGRTTLGFAGVVGARTTFEDGRAYPGVYLGARLSLMVE